MITHKPTSLFRFTISLFTLFFMALPSIAGRIVQDSLKVQGEMRHFAMYLPDGLPENAALVFVMHGYGNRGDVNTWMNKAADRHKFALCVPVGLKDSNDRHGWNVGYPSQHTMKVDDVKAMCTLAKWIQKKYKLSRENTFLTGMSNGGDLCYKMLYTNQKTFKALASLAGFTMASEYESKEIVNPIPFLEIHGTKDNVTRWWGDLKNEGGWGSYPSTPVAVGAIVAKNRCSELVIDTIKSNDIVKRAHNFIRYRYNNPKTNNRVWLYEVIDAGHTWFQDDMDTGEEVWKFFRHYLK